MQQPDQSTTPLVRDCPTCGRPLPIAAGHLDVDQAAQITGKHPETIKKAARLGEIPDAFKPFGGRRNAPWNFTRAGLEQWMRSEAAA